MVLILGPVDCGVGLSLFHGWFEVEVKPGTYTHARYMTGSM